MTPLGALDTAALALLPEGGKPSAPCCTEPPAAADAADELLGSAARLRAVLEGLREGVLITRADDTVLYANARMAELCGHSVQDLMGRRAYELLLPPDRWPDLIRRNQERLRDVSECYEAELLRRDGSTWWAQINAGPFRSPSGRIVGTLGALTDVTERRRAEEERAAAVEALRDSEERFRLLTEHAMDVITILSPDGVIRYQSPGIQRMLGYRPEEMVGRSAFDFIHRDDQGAVRREIAARLTDPETEANPVVYRMRHKSRAWRWLESVGTDLVSHPAVGGLLVNTRDITERREAEERMRWQAQHDSLTGLPNRGLFTATVDGALALARRRRGRDLSAVLFLDLDNFKNVNDSLGHETGDKLLQRVALRLQRSVPCDATVARMGGDEFGVFLPAIERPEDAAQAARELLRALQPALDCDGYELFIGGSVGIAVAPHDGDDAATLLRRADAAMYRAKEHGPGGADGSFQLYSPPMDAAAFERLMLQNSIRRAIAAEEFVVWYQPQVEAMSGRLVGVEALVRWQHPDLGLVGPEKFIPLAEETGLVTALGDWVLRRACRQAREWQLAGLRPVTIGVNLSARQFRQLDLPGRVAQALADSELDPRWLNLELTETALMAGREEPGVVRVLHDLKALGVQLSVDDFGTGYSSLAYLREFPLDVLKIDRAFVRGMARDPADRAIVRALIDLAHALNLVVVAEGVECDEQVTALRELGCDVLQGYQLGRPLPATARDEIFHPAAL